MRTVYCTISRHGHDVEVEVSPDNPGLGYVLEDTPEYDEAGGHITGVLYLADESIPLTLLEEEEARERLAEANALRGAGDFDPDDPDEELPTGREMDRAADAYFGSRPP